MVGAPAQPERRGERRGDGVGRETARREADSNVERAAGGPPPGIDGGIDQSIDGGTHGDAAKRPGQPTGPGWPNEARAWNSADEPTLVDDETGLPGQAVFDLAVHGRLASARRRLWPVAVVMLEVGLAPGLDDQDRTEAMAAFALAASSTLRHADLACRLGHRRFGLVLEDTSEEGGVWAAERLQIALAREVPAVRRLVAGVACYPTHGLEGPEVVSQARSALERAKGAYAGRGLGAVEVARAET